MAKFTAPIPKDEIKESFVWRDWFQKLSDTVFGTISAQDSSNITITGGSINGTAIGTSSASTGHFKSVSIDSPLPVKSGGTGTSNPALVPGTNITISGTWPNQTINSSGGSGSVSSVSGTTPVVSSGGTTPTISMAAASTSVSGYLTSTDWNTFNSKQSSSAPVTKTANFTVGATDVWVINNKSGSTCTATLPTASSNSGKILYFQNYQAQTLVSASSNVVAITGGSASTAILAAVAGDTCTLVSDGTNWVTMQYVRNNCLLLE